MKNSCYVICKIPFYVHVLILKNMSCRSFLLLLKNKSCPEKRNTIKMGSICRQQNKKKESSMLELSKNFVKIQDDLIYLPTALWWTGRGWPLPDHWKYWRISLDQMYISYFQFLVFASKNDFSPSYNKDIFLYFLKL